MVHAAADFMIESNMTYFNSSSSVGDTQCFQFEPVQDMIVEEDEVMTFQALTGNERDTFTNSDNGFVLTIYDDDGMLSTQASQNEAKYNVVFAPFKM